MKYIVVKGLLGLTAISLLSGCTSATTKTMALNLPTPLIEPMPARVGVYYPQELIDHAETKAVPTLAETFDITFELGPTTVDFFDQVFSQSFNDTRRITSRSPPTAETMDLDAVIEVNLAELSASYDQSKYNVSADYNVRVTYKITLWALDGSQLAVWRDTESGSLHVGFPMANIRLYTSAGSNFGAAATDAIGKVAADFLRTFSGQPKVQGWIESLERPEENINRE